MPEELVRVLYRQMSKKKLCIDWSSTVESMKRVTMVNDHRANCELWYDDSLIVNPDAVRLS